MTKSADITEEQVKHFVDELEKRNQIVIASFMVLHVLESRLLKIEKKTPILGMDPITMHLIHEIMQQNPGFDTKTAFCFKDMVERYLVSNGYESRYFKLK